MGPYNDWPSAKPTRKVTIVIWTAAAVVWKTFSITGIAGRYMSMDKGANACRAPSKINSSRWRKRETVRVGCAITRKQTSVAGPRCGNRHDTGGERGLGAQRECSGSSASERFRTWISFTAVVTIRLYTGW